MRPVPLHVHQWLERRAAHTPSAIAIRSRGSSQTFEAVNRRANQVARALRRRAAGPGAVVAICCDRSIELFWSLIGVMKTGAAYLPLEPAWGNPRIRTVLAELAPTAYVGNRLDLIGPCRSRAVLDLVSDLEEIAEQPSENVDVVMPVGRAFSVIFTSGTAGRPKGVLVPEASVLNQLSGLGTRHPLGGSDVSLAQRSYSIIGATWDLLGPWLAGIPNVLPSPRTASDPSEMWQLMVSERATVLWTSPALLRGLVEWGGARGEAYRGLRLATAGGDVMSPDFPGRWRSVFPHARLINSYGSTECSHVAQHDVTNVEPSAPRVAVGLPLAGVRAYIVDENGRTVVRGVPGTLCVAGPGVAHGYLNMAALSAARFVPDPHAVEPGARMFVTGDRAICNEDGTLEILGRSDHQVKVRGHRVDIDEVEGVLRSCDGVRSVAVLSRQNAHGEVELRAYVVPDRGPDTLLPQLRATLLDRLPAYMAPSSYVELSSLPMTASGKVDRSALAEVTAPDVQRPQERPPAGAVETRIAGIVAMALTLERVGLDDDLLALGADSLLATRISFQIYDAFRVHISLAMFFDHPTVRAMAAQVDEARAARVL